MVYYSMINACFVTILYRENCFYMQGYQI
jgi:hypothetical protein